ncbi:hypothetical protein H5410_036036 [Solanum commersonii]|uniref:Uncharacterized protein n=1 Tax=Solanum commersonii TaxID=4109 RepID=A0A9J5Y6E1_SOLCO|nr:hypothetical protein H5410_036036 [Solanum commersonii]
MRPKESNKVDDPMYCKFHPIIGHHTTKCFILKEKIMTLVREGKIIIDNDEIAETNHVSVKLDNKKDSISEVLHPVVSPKIEEGVIILQFGCFEPFEVSTLKKTTNTSKVDDFSNKESDDTWTLVALKRQKNQGTSKLRLSKVNTKSNTNQLQQCKSIRSNTKSKYINASSQKLALEFKCVTDEQRRRVKQGIVANFKGIFVPSTYSPKSERAYHDVNLSKPDGMRGRKLLKKHSAIGESYNINYIALRRSDQRSSSRRST